MAVVILVPPAAPMTNRTRPEPVLATTDGAIDDKGRLPGLMKLAGLAGIPK